MLSQNLEIAVHMSIDMAMQTCEVNGVQKKPPIADCGPQIHPLEYTLPCVPIHVQICSRVCICNGVHAECSHGHLGWWESVFMFIFPPSQKVD